jgi:hypothetical protein
VGGVWLVFEEVYGVKWKKCEKLVKKKKKVVKIFGRGKEGGPGLHQPPRS